MWLPYPYFDAWHRHHHWINPSIAVILSLATWLLLSPSNHTLAKTNPHSIANTTEAVSKTLALPTPRRHHMPCKPHLALLRATRMALQWLHWEHQQNHWKGRLQGDWSTQLQWLDLLTSFGLQVQSLSWTQAQNQHLELEWTAQCHDPN